MFRIRGQRRQELVQSGRVGQRREPDLVGWWPFALQPIQDDLKEGLAGRVGIGHVRLLIGVIH